MQARGARRNGSNVPGAQVVEITVLALLAGALVLAVLFQGGASAPPVDSSAAINVRVEHGDTLWSLARDNHVPGVAMEQAVDAIRALNRLDGDTLVVGQVIRVPSTRSHQTAMASR